jgi:GrpB-like predicted nucleotidyltransferase (UPF0157 family)/SAM-dependent methyltransferase
MIDDSGLGLERGSVRVVAPDPAWPALYRAEKERLAACIAEADLAPLIFEHVGSTAIPGLVAKPIIDLMAAYEAEADPRVYFDALRDAGYEHRGPQGAPERELFVRGSAARRTHHLNLARAGGTFWHDHLAFRDRLRREPEAVAAYSALKRRLAAEHATDRGQYTAAKWAFVRRVLAGEPIAEHGPPIEWAHRYFEQGYAQRWSLGPPTLETERDADALWNHLRLTPGAPALDVGCGHGRLAIALAKRGADVTGLDFATTLIARAVEMSGALGVTARWVRADMRALPVRAETFQAAVLFDAFGFFESDDENHLVLRELARALVPAGRVALKVANAEAIVARFRSRDREVKGERTLEIERTLVSDPPRLIEDVVIRGLEHIDRYQRRQRLYRLAEVSAALENAGFVLIDVAATIHGAPFDPSTSASMVIVAERSR